MSFDLEEEGKWHILIAKGKMKNEVAQYHGFSGTHGNAEIKRTRIKISYPKLSDIDFFAPVPLLNKEASINQAADETTEAPATTAASTGSSVSPFFIMLTAISTLFSTL